MPDSVPSNAPSMPDFAEKAALQFGGNNSGCCGWKSECSFAAKQSLRAFLGQFACAFAEGLPRIPRCRCNPSRMRFLRLEFEGSSSNSGCSRESCPARFPEYRGSKRAAHRARFFAAHSPKYRAESFGPSALSVRAYRTRRNRGFARACSSASPPSAVRTERWRGPWQELGAEQPLRSISSHKS